jgi:hypothetical protein
MPKKRNYEREYAQYQGTAEQKANRAQRNAARRMMERTHGDLPSTTDVDHKRPIRSGGSNAKGNLRLRSESRNSNWRNTK